MATESAFAVRDFLQYAHDNWRSPPGFVLLVGDASLDPRNFLGQGAFDFAPTKLIDTAEMETASDDWLVDWNDDGVPDVAVGRLSVRTSDEATRVVNKILGYAGAAELPRGGLFVADINGDGSDFEQTSQLSAAVVSDIMPVDRYFRSQPGSTLSGLVAKLDAGPFLVNYVGHGSVEEWEGSLATADATALTNQHLSIYVSMNCLNGFFQDVYTESLPETLMKAPPGGAVAAWAPSTLTSFDRQAVLNREFLKRLTRTSLGEAAMAAKAADGDPDTQRTWILFGDPTLFGRPRGSDGGATDGSAEAGASSDGGVDGGATDAASIDAGSDAGADARGQPPGGGGCGCRFTASSASPAPGIVPLTVVLVMTLVRRRRLGGKAVVPGSIHEPSIGQAFTRSLRITGLMKLGTGIGFPAASVTAPRRHFSTIEVAAVPGEQHAVAGALGTAFEDTMGRCVPGVSRPILSGASSIRKSTTSMFVLKVYVRVVSLAGAP